MIDNLTKENIELRSQFNQLKIPMLVLVMVVFNTVAFKVMIVMMRLKKKNKKNKNKQMKLDLDIMRMVLLGFQNHPIDYNMTHNRY